MRDDEYGWNALDVLGSIPYGIAETLAGFPGVRDTQFGNWLQDTFPGAANFRAEQPGWSTAIDLGSSVIPFIGWGAALNRARTGAGLLGLTNRAGVAAASLAPRNAPLAFALGETVRYAPPAAALTGFDLLGGRYESPVEALTSFGLGTIGGAGLQLAGHALSPLVSRFARPVDDWLQTIQPRNPDPVTFGGTWRNMFEPTPELSALYGFSTNIQRAASETAAVPAVQEALAPTLEPQIRAAALHDLVREVESGMHQGVDVDLLKGQYDNEIRTILRQELDPADAPFRYPAGETPSATARFAHDRLVRLGPNNNGTRVRVPLTSGGSGIENPDVLAGQLGLPQGWIHDTQFPGLTQVAFNSAEDFRNHVGLGPNPNGWRRLERNGPAGRHVWAVRQEADNGQYLVTVEVPTVGADIHRMTGRARYASTQKLDKAEPARVFFSFKTHNPSRFFPEMRADFDSPDPGMIGRLDDRIPRGVSETLDKAMDFRRVFLNPETIKAAYAAKYGSPQQRQAFLKAVLAGPTMGKEIAKVLETYTMPTQFQLRDNPYGRAILSLHQALFDAAEGRARAVLHGTASIPEDKSALTSLFAPAKIDDTEALAATLRQTALEQPEALDLVRRAAFEDKFPIESIEGTPAGQWLKKALEVNLKEIEDGNKAIEALRVAGATDARTIPIRKGHIGLSRRWDGSVFVPIYREGAVNPVAVRAGHGKQQANVKADEWIAHFEAKDGVRYRKGQPFISGETDGVTPDWARNVTMSPGLLEPRAGMRGYEHEFEPYKHMDDLIAELEENYVVRRRYIASVIADALTGGKLNQLKARDAHAYNIVQTRINQLKGQPGPFEKRVNQIVDKALAPALGTNSFSRVADGINEFMFHMLHGVGNVATPLLNITSVLQTQLPSAMNFLTANPNTLRSMGYLIPMIGADGLPRAGVHVMPNPLGLIQGGLKKAMSQDPEVKEIYNVLFNRKIMGTGLANEYTGQDRAIATRASEGIRGADDIAFHAKRWSSMMMQKSEQISRVQAAGMALHSMDLMEAATGARFTIDEKISNAARFVEQTNFGYFTSDRPQMFTTPMGALFGNQKTWMTNYLFMMAEYMGLARNGQYLPLLMTAGTTALLGGVFAVPFAGQALDAITETFAGKDATEYIYENLGEGGNAISFGLPALFGMSLTGNVAAPGSNLAHDAEFFFTIVALERAKLLGRAIGRAWDDQVTLGMNPFTDQLFQRQMAQALAPRAVYRTWEAITSDQLRSAATGYPMIKDLGWGARVMNSLGFRTTDIALQYQAYERLVSDRDSMRQKISLFGEAYAMASVNNDRQRMAELLQQAAISGVDINRVMQSAQVRMRNMGLDMFGRNFNQEQLDRYQATLAAGGM